MYNSIITGTGYYVPENIVTNDDLSKLMDTSDAWIQEIPLPLWGYVLPKWLWKRLR